MALMAEFEALLDLACRQELKKRARALEIEADKGQIAYGKDEAPCYADTPEGAQKRALARELFKLAEKEPTR